MTTHSLWRYVLPSALLALAPGAAAFAGDVSGLVTFTAGTPAVAAEVNGNFAAVKSAVDENHARVTALETENAALVARIVALEAKLASVSVMTYNGQPTVRFTGVNVQVVNGLDATETANGTGNLVVGYDEPDGPSSWRCTIGTDPATGTRVTNEPACTAAGGTWTLNGFKTGSHHLVGGSHNSYSRWGGIVSGYGNTVNYDYAAVSGGYGNTASGQYSSVSAGWRNVAGGQYSSVSGGGSNTASGQYGAVSGGASNNASGAQSSVCGGASNSASGSASSIGGGAGNAATGSFSSVSGGGAATANSGNRALHDYSSVLGGAAQSTTAVSQTIPALP